MKRFMSSIVLVCVLALLVSSCVSYESSLRTRYGYNNTPQQQQPYYAPQSQIPPQNYSGQGDYNQNYNQNNTQGYNQGYGQQPAMRLQYGSQITFQNFYDELSPFGEWIDTREYGFVWRPFGIDAGWRPYLHNGRWVYTEYAWTWVSDYIWGWAPFHYGRWRLDPFYGWVWHPGNVWGPAWVEWRFWNNNYCWAPLLPGVNVGMGYRGGNYHWSSWNAVPGRYFTQRNLWNHCLPYTQVNTFINNTTIINNTTVINNNTYFTGPAMTDVERYSGKVIPLSLRNLNKVAVSTVDDNSVSIYRPDVNDNSGKAQNTAYRPANATPANRATTGKANTLLNETPENADNIAAPKGNPYNPSTQSRDASSPFITPAPSGGKSTPSGLGGESGGGGKVAPMPTPVDDERRNTVTPNETGIPKTSPVKQAEPLQPRNQNPTKSNPFGSPAAVPEQQNQQREEARQQQEQQQRYQKQAQEEQQRQQEQRLQQEQRQREEQRQQEQQRYQKQAQEEQQRQREEQRQQEQQRYQKQAEQQQREEIKKQEQQQRQREEQRYQKQAQEEQQRKQEQPKSEPRKSSDGEVKKSSPPQAPPQNYQKKKGED